MINYVILEDDKNTVLVLRQFLESYKNLHYNGFSTSVDDSIKLLSEKEIDLCLADVRIVGGTTFDVFSRLNEINFQIIFITAYEEYALKAFKLSAIDYILKPISEEELKHAIDNYLNNRYQSIDIKKRLNHFSDIQTQKEKKIVITTKDEYVIFPLKDISFLESEGCYTKFYIKKDIIISSKPLGFYDQLLNDLNFLRIHHKYMVNIEHIKSILKGTPVFIKLIDDNILPVSKYSKTELLKFLSI